MTCWDWLVSGCWEIKGNKVCTKFLHSFPSCLSLLSSSSRMIKAYTTFVLVQMPHGCGFKAHLLKMGRCNTGMCFNEDIPLIFMLTMSIHSCRAFMRHSRVKPQVHLDIQMFVVYYNMSMKSLTYIWVIRLQVGHRGLLICNI